MEPISFIVPTFNRADVLDQALLAILSQMDDRDELIVVDDGSVDNTAELVSRLAPRVQYCYQENGGKSLALNNGLNKANNELIWICDDDDILRPGAVGILRKAISGTNIDFVFGKYSRFADVNGVRVDLGTGYWPDLSAGTPVRHILEDAFVMQNAALVRKSSYYTVGLFDETMLRSLDYDMFARLAVVSNCAYIDHMIFDQRKHDGIRGPNAALHSVEDVESVWLKYDSMIFERLRSRLPIEFYESLFVSSSNQLRRRAALFQRACIEARHGRWACALGDLWDACHLPGGELDAGEAEICSRILNGKASEKTLITEDHLRFLRSLYMKSKIGRSVVNAMIRGSLWRLRSSAPNNRKFIMRIIYYVLSPINWVSFGSYIVLERLISRDQQLREVEKFAPARQSWSAARIAAA